jgi:hypothetical protein
MLAAGELLKMALMPLGMPGLALRSGGGGAYGHVL